MASMSGNPWDAPNSDDTADSVTALRRSSLSPGAPRTLSRSGSPSSPGTPPLQRGLSRRQSSKRSEAPPATLARGVSTWGTILESESLSPTLQIILLAPALCYAFTVLLWLFNGTDIEYARELGPVSFAALCLHLFAAAESPSLTVWEMVHFWFHAACEVLVANDFTLQLGGGIGGAVATSVLMLIFWPVGWMCLRTLRQKLNHSSRLQRLENVAESALGSGLWLLIISLYLGAQSLSCMVYEGVTDCSEKNAGIRHLNYSASTTYLLIMMFRHLGGVTVKQVMLFRLRPHQSYAVVLMCATSSYSLYEYAAGGIPFATAATELIADLVIFTLWFLSITVLIYRTPLQYTPPILNLHTVILDSHAVLTALQIAPDGAISAEERVRLSAAGGPLAQDKGALAQVLRQTKPLNPRETRGFDSGSAGANLNATTSFSTTTASAATTAAAEGAAGEVAAVELGAGFEASFGTENGDRNSARNRSRTRSRSFSGRQVASSFSPPSKGSSGNGSKNSSPPQRSSVRLTRSRSPVASHYANQQQQNGGYCGSSQQQLQHYGAFAEEGEAGSDSESGYYSSNGQSNGHGNGWGDVESGVRRTTGSRFKARLGLPQTAAGGTLRWEKAGQGGEGSAGTIAGSEAVYVHPLLRYYRETGRVPPLSFIVTYLCEIVFFWRFMLFMLTVGYKLFLTLAVYIIMNRHWAQIFTPLSTSALVVHWLLTLGCDPRDRVSNQAMNLHFWFHALSEIPEILVWMKKGQVPQVIFNVGVLLVVWPWVFIAYKRVINTLRIKSKGKELTVSTTLFWEGSFLMIIEFYLAFQAHGCLVHLPASREGECTNIIHANLISGMNLIMIFLVVRVILFKLGGLTITRMLHLDLQGFEVLVLTFSLSSGLMSLYFFANRITGVSEVSSTRSILEWSTMILWILVCMLMAYKTSRNGGSLARTDTPASSPEITAVTPADNGSVHAVQLSPKQPLKSAASSSSVASGSGGTGCTTPTTPPPLAQHSSSSGGGNSSSSTRVPTSGVELSAVAVQLSEEDRILAAAAARRKASTKTASPNRSRTPGTAGGASLRTGQPRSNSGVSLAGMSSSNSHGALQSFDRISSGHEAAAAAAAAKEELQCMESGQYEYSTTFDGSSTAMTITSPPAGASTPSTPYNNDDVAVLDPDDVTRLPRGGTLQCCCCHCWHSFVALVDYRNSQNNLPFFRVLFTSATAVYLGLMITVATGGCPRGLATAMVGVSFSSVCFHWLICIEHPTSTFEVLHLLGHAGTELLSTLLWLQQGEWVPALYSLWALLAVYPCLFYGIQALKLDLQRKFSEHHVALVKAAIGIFLQSAFLLGVLLLLSFECFGCLSAKPEAECQALLYANTQVGLSVTLGFLVYLGLIVLQNIGPRAVLTMSFTWHQVAVISCSAFAVVLCIFSVASRNLSKLQHDLVEHGVEFGTLGAWYTALIILWRRRAWYDVEPPLEDGSDAINGASAGAMHSIAEGANPLYQHGSAHGSSGIRPRSGSGWLDVDVLGPRRVPAPVSALKKAQSQQRLQQQLQQQHQQQSADSAVTLVAHNSTDGESSRTDSPQRSITFV